MNHTSRALVIGALSALSAMLAGNAVATTTSVTAEAFVSGTTVRQSFTAGAEGTQATASQVIPSPFGDAFISAQASSLPGALRAAGVARTNGSPGGFEGDASASWADSFVISAPGYDTSMTGLFSGAVQVTGELLVAFLGRVYSDTLIFATVDLFPGTGFNGGRTIVNGSARNFVGYDIVGGHIGSDSFSLVFSDVPFTFNQPIDVYLGLSVIAAVNAIDAGVTGRADANYANTMTWSGLSNVRDQNGIQPLTYSALSTGSGFNFAANPTAVPEPSSVLLVACGLLYIVLGKQRRRRAWP